MVKTPERRHVARLTVPVPLSGPGLGSQQVRLCDLSPLCARIENVRPLLDKGKASHCLFPGPPAGHLGRSLQGPVSAAAPGHSAGRIGSKGPPMTEQPQRRRLPRYPVQIPMVYYREAEPHQLGAGWTHNLCSHGVGVEFDFSLRPWLPIGLRIVTNYGPLDLRARVIWIGSLQVGGGMLHGLEFRQVTPPQREFLEDYAKLLQGQARVGARFSLDLPARCQLKSAPGPSLRGRTGNISRGGAMLYLPQAVPVRSVLRVTISTAAGSADVDGVIVWVDPPTKRPPGAPIRHGMEFVLFDWPTALVLSRVLAGRPQGHASD